MAERPLVPIRFNASIAVGVRVPYFSGRYSDGLYVDRVRVAFALNTQRLLRVRVWVTSDTSTLVETPGTPSRTMPRGLSLLASEGSSSVDYVVGDGQEGEMVINIGRAFPPGSYVAVDADNQSTTAPHTLDCSVDVRELDRG